MLPVELASLVSDLAFAFFGLGMLAVFSGLWLLSFVRWLLDLLTESDWWASHVTSPALASVLAARSRRRERGRISFIFVIALVVLVSVLASCAAPVPFHADSSVWYDDVKKGW